MGRKMGVLSSSTPPLVLLGSVEFRQLFALVDRVREPQRLGAIISQTTVLQAEKTTSSVEEVPGKKQARSLSAASQQWLALARTPPTSLPIRRARLVRWLASPLERRKATLINAKRSDAGRNHWKRKIVQLEFHAGDVRLRGVHFANSVTQSRHPTRVTVIPEGIDQSVAKLLLSGRAKGGTLDEYAIHLKHSVELALERRKVLALGGNCFRDVELLARLYVACESFERGGMETREVVDRALTALCFEGVSTRAVLPGFQG